MAEYIEREAARALIKNFGKGAISDGRMELDTVDDIILLASAVECLPAADVAPVVHGRWIPRVNPQWPAHRHDACSVCGWWNTKNALCYDGNHKPGHSLNYCPNCGAKMDGEEQDDE